MEAILWRWMVSIDVNIGDDEVADDVLSATMIAVEHNPASCSAASAEICASDARFAQLRGSG